MPGPKPFLWSAEKSAKTIRRGLALNRARISFPFPLNLGSFFDLRRTYDGIRKDTLANYDGLRIQALRHGQLRVAAWGANTVRTEYAVLSGVPLAALGVH